MSETPSYLAAIEMAEDAAKERAKRLERAERFARLWKRMAKTLMGRSWYQHGKKHGAAEARARIVELVRGMMCKDDVGDCDLCIAYNAVITTIEANP